MKMIVKLARKTWKKSPAMPSTAEIASGTDDRDLLRPLPARSRPRRCLRARTARRSRAASRPWPAAPGGSPARCRRAERAAAGRAAVTASAVPMHRHGRGKPARHPRLRHHDAHRVLEDERQEDPDEDDQERVADLPDRRRHGDDGSDEQHRAQREDDLDAPRPTRLHPPDCTTPGGRHSPSPSPPRACDGAVDAAYCRSWYPSRGWSRPRPASFPSRTGGSSSTQQRLGGSIARAARDAPSPSRAGRTSRRSGSICSSSRRASRSGCTTGRQTRRTSSSSRARRCCSSRAKSGRCAGGTSCTARPGRSTSIVGAGDGPVRSPRRRGA